VRKNLLQMALVLAKCFLMQAVTTEDLKSMDIRNLRSFAVERDQMLLVAMRVIRKLENQVNRLSEELGAKNQQVLFTAQALSRMQHYAFGDSSERREADTTPLFGAATLATIETAEEEKPALKKKSRHGRRPQPGLPIQDVNHTIDPDDVKKYEFEVWEGQFEESELITVVPSRIVLQRHRRQKYIQRDKETGETKIITAPGPLKLKEGSRYSLEFGVEVGLAKYHWHLPLDRQRKMLAEHGLDITTQAIFDQTDTIAWYLRNTVFKDIIDEIHKSRINQADDTVWKNLGKKQAGEKRTKFYLWSVVSPRATCFNIYDGRNRKIAKNFLGALKGVLISDGHHSFKVLASPDLKLANDWCHVRRKFVLAESAYKEESEFFIDKIRDLFAIEDQLKGRPPNEVLSARQGLSKPLIDLIRGRLDSLAHILPQSSLGRAIAYTNKLWEGLTLFLSDPTVPISTNGVERAVRGPALGRKNHYGSRNLTTADVAAVWYSVIETCKMHGVSPREYLTETLTAILKKKPYKMPWEWNNSPADLILN
jgi:transposase